MGAITFLAGLFSTDGSATVSDYLSYASTLSFLWSGVCVLVGTILLLFRQKRWGHGFLLTACILLLLGVMEYSFSDMVL